MYIINSTDLVTLMSWSQSELGARNLLEAKNKLTQAKEKLAQLDPRPWTDALANQIDAAEKAIEQVN